ncbi:hypothetical protein E8E13_002243 [Curvularia kusanoi]|uniref:Heterokaryon incompatibility domain-containing protein n=1 Tax=Curvularia kusanoi TaxID=90978 RepID=A0A9P4T5W6_CURKU|nr:hypothetical protein E8E13_002243 [Curvularia kusanoi]
MFFRREVLYNNRKKRDDLIAGIVEGPVVLQYRLSNLLDPFLDIKIRDMNSIVFFERFRPPLSDELLKEPLEWSEIREANPSLQFSLDVCLSWLSTCLKEHKRCWPCDAKASKSLPTRLLDVSVPGQQSIRLVHSKDIEEPEEAVYVTLSYCWGETNDVARTTKENFTDRQNAIQVETLPQTLQDAITVTRGLGIQYLWIDALCIVQGSADNNEDWERELPNMGDIYGQSLFTIAASSANNSNVGFIRRELHANWPVFNFLLKGIRYNETTHEVYQLLARIPEWYDVDTESPLSERGWVLQERMLATRTIYWTADGMFWQCEERMDNECSSLVEWNIPPIRIHEIVEQMQRYLDPDAYPQPGWPGLIKNNVEGLRLWYEVVEDLSNRTFTVLTDKIPAITGLGRKVAQTCGVGFKSGTFIPFQPQEVAWKVQTTSTHLSQRVHGIPSWSWASVDKLVRFSAYLQQENFTLLMRSAFLDGQKLHMSSRLGRLSVKRSDDENIPFTFEPVNARSFISSLDNYNRTQIIWFDTIEDTPRGEKSTTICAQWGSWKLGRYKQEAIGTTNFGVLLLSPIDEERHIYRRIGWGQFVEKGYFDKHYTDITII